eukprot:TRINITY_DN1052_c0_g1_i2.p1 TRINITY_DN1052_c0_g1~~TRINITY_DN1052_c0_g1_i2.p1  ORF type:complete len:321 (-),score=50.76 TRINITY_DN1052_c0_g1_i2:815-1777(-)
MVSPSGKWISRKIFSQSKFDGEAMRVFVTGATGFVGSAVVKELLSAGHEVLGLVRSDEAAERLAKTGVSTFRGDVEDLQSLKSGAASCDGVIHTAFNHDFSKFAENCESDRRAIEAMGSVLAGSNRPIVVTSGIGLLRADRPVVETDKVGEHSPRKASEDAVAAIVAKGVNASVVRLPPSVHGKGDHGFVPILINMARQHGYAACINDGSNCWAAVHRFDAACAFRLALERAEPNAVYHAVDEGALAFGDIAATIASGLGIAKKSLTTEEAHGYFNWFSHFAAIDCPASSDITREKLGWVPSQIGLFDDMKTGGYFDPVP